jgi:hypothetical protein
VRGPSAGRCPRLQVGRGSQHAWADHRWVGDQFAGHRDHRGPRQHRVNFQPLGRFVERDTAQVGQHSLCFAQLSFDSQPVPVWLGPRHGAPSGLVPHPSQGTSPAGSGPTPLGLPSRRSVVDRMAAAWPGSHSALSPGGLLISASGRCCRRWGAGAGTHSSRRCSAPGRLLVRPRAHVRPRVACRAEGDGRQARRRDAARAAIAESCRLARPRWCGAGPRRRRAPR